MSGEYFIKWFAAITVKLSEKGTVATNKNTEEVLYS